MSARPSVPIDRQALVSRHSPRGSTVDPRGGLTVGNGEFAFTADVTGLQTLNETYAVGLQTQAHWAWHVVPPKFAGVEPASFEETPVTVYNHTAYYPIKKGPGPLLDYLRGNPHRLNLCRAFLRRWENGSAAPAAAAAPIQPADVSEIAQVLHLWNGTLSSSFSLDGASVDVETAAHPTMDAVGIRACSPLLGSRRLAVGLAFPYGSMAFKGGSDWSLPSRHATELVTPADACAPTPVLRRAVDGTEYYAHLRLNLSGAASASACAQLVAGDVPHDWAVVVAPRAGPTRPARAGQHGAAAGTSCVELTLWLSPSRQRGAIPSVDELLGASAAGWSAAWRRGAALELSGSTAAGAAELESRVVLSQYLMMSQSAGSMPPQETGLMINSWFGKFNLEMRWHHQAHFYLYGRGELARRADGYFERARNLSAWHTSARQGYRGVRWPKMVGPPELMSWADGFTLFTGPSDAGPWVIWQQPHPIVFAELAYRAEPAQATLARYNRTVHDTADFMADFALQSDSGAPGGCLSLGPPLFTAEIEDNDDHPASETSDPTFELSYWRMGLRLAASWRARQGLPVEPRWHAASSRLCRPTARPINGSGSDRVYFPYASSPPEDFAKRGTATQVFGMAFGPGTPDGVDAAVLNATLTHALAALGMCRNTPWGSDPPLYAMAAARLGRPALAARLLADPERTWTRNYLPSGHYAEGSFLPVYLPANGALLSAVAMMAAGWDGDGGREAPGFPRDGTWSVRAEGFAKML